MKNWKKTSLHISTAMAISFILHPLEALAVENIAIPISGTAIVSSVTNMQISPSDLNMGDVGLDTNKSLTFTITNMGQDVDDVIVINSAELVGANRGEFQFNLPGYTNLQPGESLDVEVLFTPLTIGLKSVAIKFNTEGASADHVVMIKGRAELGATSELTAAVQSLTMKTVVMGNKGVSTVLLSNTGDVGAPLLDIISVELSGDNAEDFTTNGGSLTAMAPGDNQLLYVTMNGTTYGNKSAELTLKHNGINPPVKIALGGNVVNPEEPKETPVFGQDVLEGFVAERPTSLQFGPDGKLYVTEMNGLIHVLSVARTGKNKYTVTDQKTLDIISTMVNHNDDGTVNNAVKGRLVTGILVVGTAAQPIIYLASGDPRQGAGPSGKDSGLDTNSVIISRLTYNNGNWTKQDVVRGLPRSEENHQGNGLVLDKSGTKLFIAVGGNTNTGAPSNNFAMATEVALGAAVLEIDLNNLGALPYDVPTLDDEDRAGPVDANDPFGGNNGKNQGILKANGPVKVYSPGYRNHYDLVLTKSGRLYTFDNGGNAGWGGEPVGNCTNNVDNVGSTYHDALHYINKRGYYGGHPNPTRGNKGNTFNASNPQSPIEGAANPEECHFLIPGVTDAAIDKIWGSVNGMDEYTASNFNNAMKGDLLAASFNKAIYRFELNKAGSVVQAKTKLFPDSGIVPLDVTAQDDNQNFPGTIWVVDFQGNKISVFEPEDY